MTTTLQPPRSLRYYHCSHETELSHDLQNLTLVLILSFMNCFLKLIASVHIFFDESTDFFILYRHAEINYRTGA